MTSDIVTTPANKDKFEQALDNLLGDHVAPEVLMAEFDDILAVKPTVMEMGSDAVLPWLGRVKAALHSWDALEATNLIMIEPRLHSNDSRDNERGYRELIAMIYQARAALRLRITPISVLAGKGMVHDYFDGVRKVIERAATGVLFVDPYLDADFVSRYLAYTPKSVQIRLLTREKLATLLPAIDTFGAQRNEKILVRSTDKIHDRYVFVDGKECYQSGASFKDGGKNAPTTLTPIIDAFTAVQQTYEAIWTGAKVER